jgi:hypothetical protein
MTVNDIVTQLKYGELRSIAAKDDLPAIVSYINLAMIALYGRFKIVRSTQTIPIVDGTYTYTLDPNLLAIETIRNSTTELAINDESDSTSILTLSYDTIQIPTDSTDISLDVLYVANPTTTLIDATDSVTLAQTLRLPTQLIEPLLHYIGYRAHASMNGDIKAENNTHYMRYEASCKRIIAAGLVRIDTVPATVSTQESITN